MVSVRIIPRYHMGILTDISVAACFPHLVATEAPSLKPLCHQCRNCNTCAELGNLGTNAAENSSVNDEQENATQPKKETLLERYERWSKDHERRQDEMRSKYGSDYHMGMI